MSGKLLLCAILLLGLSSFNAVAGGTGCIDYEHYPHWVAGSGQQDENIVASDSYLYTAGYGGFRIIDLHSPAAPEVIGGLYTNQRRCRVAIAGNLAFIAGIEPGSISSLRVVSIANPAAPAILGSLDISNYGVANVAVAGSFVYMVGTRSTGTWSSLRVIDVSTPGNPLAVGSFDWPTQESDYMGLSVEESTAYVTEGSILRTIDVSKPSQPNIVGGVQLPASSYAITLAGSRAYVASDAGLQIVDVSSHNAPKVVGSLNTAGSVRGVTVVGTLAYVVNSWPSFGLSVIDVSSPTAPALKLTVPTQPFPVGVAIVGSYAYVAANLDQDPGDSSTGLQVIAFPTLSEPPIVGTLTGAGQGVPIVVNESYVYVSGGLGLNVIDVSTPSAPTIVGSVAMSPGLVAGSHMYVMSEHTLQVVDVSNPREPAITGRVDIGSAGAVFAVGSYVYVAAGPGVKLVDASNPSAPVIVGTVSLSANYLAAAGSSIYAASWGGMLSVIDVSLPATPTVVWSSSDFYTSPTSLAVDGSSLYTTDSHNSATTLYVLDVSTPSAPTWRGSTYLALGSSNLTAAGSYVYTGTQVIDVSAPNAFRFVGNLEARNLAIRGSYLYTVADGNFYVLPAQCPNAYPIDTIPPKITVNLSRDLLWPPNHKLVEVCATVKVMDTADPAPTFKLLSIATFDGKHAANATEDIKGAEFGTADLCYDLRAERGGAGEGREYRIIYEAKDAANNVAYDTVSVRVPANASHHAPESASLVTALSSVYPNPFNPETTVDYSLESAQQVVISIYDVRGLLVRHLVGQSMSAGEHRATWNGVDDAGQSASSGIYFVRMTAGTYTETRKIVMLK